MDRWETIVKDNLVPAFFPDGPGAKDATYAHHRLVPKHIQMHQLVCEKFGVSLAAAMKTILNWFGQYKRTKGMYKYGCVVCW